MNTENTEVMEFDFRRILEAIIDRWKMIAITTITLGLCAALYSSFLITPLYKASATMYVNNNKNTVSENLSNNDITASLQLVPTVMRIFDSRTTLGEVAKKIDLGYTADDIGNMISFSSAEDAQILTLTVVNPNPEHAYIIANAIADTAPIKATEIMDGSSVKVIDYAEKPDHPFSPKVLKNTFMGLVLGFLISVCVAVLIELTDNSIREENDIKKLYPDVPIIGTVPEIKVTLDEKTN